MTRVPASHRRRTARRSSSTSPPHTPCAPTPNACRSESSRQSGRTGQRAQTAMACAAWSRALATSRVTGNQSSGSTREPAHRASRYTRPASSPSVRSRGSRRTWRGLETISTWLHLLPSGQLVAPSSPSRQRLRIPSPVSGEPSTLGMRARGWRRQAGIMGVTLCVRLGDGGTIVAISGEVDVCTEAPLQQALLRIIRERSARLMLDLSGVSFMDCAGPAGAPGDPAPRRVARRVHAPDRGVGGGPADHRIDRRARGLGHGAEHHGPFRPILLAPVLNQVSAARECRVRDGACSSTRHARGRG